MCMRIIYCLSKTEMVKLLSDAGDSTTRVARSSWPVRAAPVARWSRTASCSRSPSRCSRPGWAPRTDRPATRQTVENISTRNTAMNRVVMIPWRRHRDWAAACEWAWSSCTECAVGRCVTPWRPAQTEITSQYKSCTVHVLCSTFNTVPCFVLADESSGKSIDVDQSPPPPPVTYREHFCLVSRLPCSSLNLAGCFHDCVRARVSIWWGAEENAGGKC